jgi:hypothetical protein
MGSERKGKRLIKERKCLKRAGIAKKEEKKGKLSRKERITG